MDITINIDSTVLAELMTLLNDRYNYGLELFLLSVDEGITGYRDDSLEVFVVLVISCYHCYYYSHLPLFIYIIP